MADTERLICAAVDLQDGAKGIRFNLQWGTRSLAAFAVRSNGKVYAYLNNCPHQGTELDWQEGEFFDESKLYLLCATHGAAFFPDTGYCCGGPCRGRSLVKVAVEERDEHFYWLEPT
jgi:nitrite reductase/ring-hydroxylating ferredoxin subunit